MINENLEHEVILEPVKKEDFTQFKKDLQDSFAVAVVETFGSIEDGPIPEDKDIEECYEAQGAHTFHIVSYGLRVGGIIVKIDEKTMHNSLDFFFINKNVHSKGLGYKAWKAIEEKYPETKVWETVTPYFERRNIHFYVNKCGFKIVEYYNKYHKDPHMAEEEELPGDEDFFRFEKVMKK